jgi:hypothetical protein
VVSLWRREISSRCRWSVGRRRAAIDGGIDDETAVGAVDGCENDEDVIEIAEKIVRSPLSSGCRWAKSLLGVLSVNWAITNVSRNGLAWPLWWSDRGGRGPSTVYQWRISMMISLR